MRSCPPSELAFAQVREDPLVEWRVVQDLVAQTERPLRIFLVGSGGDTALSLLAEPRVARVEVVDQSAAQLFLVQLRLAAMQRLDLDEQLELVGAAPSERRMALYERLRPELPAACAAHWDARPEQVAYGLNQVGRFEELFRELVRELGAQGVDPREGAGTPGWRQAFAVVFEREKLARTFTRAAVDFSMEREFDEHFAGVFLAAIRRWAPDENYFVEQVLTDRYGSGRPPYLDAAWQARARSAGLERLRFHQGSCWEVLRSLPDDFDLIQTSNISDWIPVPELRALLGEVASRLRPGGAWVGRRLNGDHVLVDVASTHFDVSLVEDRAFFYSEVLVGRPR